ncbi:hypothetical protein V6N13_042629 [Hibiscus sabdariffa]
MYMDFITTFRERLVFAKVCVEVVVGAKLSKTIEVMLLGGSSVAIRVIVTWLPPCWYKCKIYGHNDEVCPKDDPKSFQDWKVKVVIKYLMELKESSQFFDRFERQVKESSKVFESVVAKMMQDTERQVADSSKANKGLVDIVQSSEL